MIDLGEAHTPPLPFLHSRDGRNSNYNLCQTIKMEVKMEPRKFIIEKDRVILLTESDTQTGIGEKVLSLRRCIKNINKSHDLNRCVVQTVAMVKGTNLGIHLVFQAVPVSELIPEFGSQINRFLSLNNEQVKWYAYIMENPNEARFITWGNTINETINRIENEICNEVIPYAWN